MSSAMCIMALLLVAAVALAQDAAAAASGSRDLLQIAPQTAPDFTVVVPPPPPTPALMDPTAVEGDLRLVRQVTTNGFTTGALQVFHDGAFGAVCNVGFDSVDADVACRQLGFPVGGFSLDSLFPGGRPFPEIQAPFVLENLACSGAEQRLVDCPLDETNSDYASVYNDYGYSRIPNQCEPFAQSYAFVACGSPPAPGGPSEGDLRLTGGGASESGALFGRLEVFSTGGWGTVCGGLPIRTRPIRTSPFAPFDPAVFSAASADVACQQLGFQEGVQTATPALVSDTLRQVPILIGGATCGGSEDILTDCPGVSIGNNTRSCGHINDVSLVCFNGADPAMDGSVRLVGGGSGPGYEYGRLEVFLRGFWSNVCNVDGFTPDSAQVACAALGFGGGASLQFFQPFTGVEASVLDAALPVALAGVDCAGTETSLLECTSNDARVPECAAGGANTTDATVLACGNSVGAGCSKTPPEEESSVRLVGGFGTLCDPLHTGVVEVFHFGEWGALCFGSSDDDQLVADVVCRQLGFPHGTPVDPREAQTEVIEYSFYGGLYDTPDESEGPQERFWLSAASCRGSEERLVDCDIRPGFRTANEGCTGTSVTRFQAACRQFAVSEALEDVTTPGAVEGDVRLVNETSIANWQVGRVEVFFEGSWSQVCSAGFDGTDADVACRQLGYGVGSSAASATGVSEELSVYPEVAITLPDCNGSEASLLACGGEVPTGISRFGATRGCFQDGDKGLLLACVAQPMPGGVEGAVRLVDSREEDGVTVGTPQVFHAGAWGSFCSGNVGFFDYNDDLTEAAASLVCRELGFQEGIFQGMAEVAPNTTLLPPWLSSLDCVGTEVDVSDCNNSGFGSVSSCGMTQELICLTGTGVATGTARLTGGRADPGGAWAYGRLEVFNRIGYSSFRATSSPFGPASGLGRNAAVVACRSLGFEAGVEITAGSTSALPGPAGDIQPITSIACVGDETTLTECDISNIYFQDYEDTDSNTVAVLCSTPSGCSTETAPPADGDVRLVPLINATSESAPCDAVYQGVVQVFSDGIWGILCTSEFGREGRTGFVVVAKVICRQLGFPFGSVFDSSASRGRGDPDDQYDYADYSSGSPLSAPLDDVPVFATRVSCTGKEDRLDECFFPEREPSFSSSAPSPAPGVSSSCERLQATRLTVACRQFEIEDSAVIRR